VESIFSVKKQQGVKGQSTDVL